MTSTQYVRRQPTETEAPTACARAADEQRAAVSRRGLLGAAGAASPDWPRALPVDLRWEARGPLRTAAAGHAYYPFYGEHQAGILTPVQDRLHFAALT
jgi:deferrochelatase/peroxidase EfeB